MTVDGKIQGILVNFSISQDNSKTANQELVVASDLVRFTKAKRDIMTDQDLLIVQKSANREFHLSFQWNRHGSIDLH